MSRSIYDRVRAAQAAQAKAQKAAEYKAGESVRRSQAAKVAAEVRAERRLDALLSGEVEPRNMREVHLLDRMDDM